MNYVDNAAHKHKVVALVTTCVLDRIFLQG